MLETYTFCWYPYPEYKPTTGGEYLVTKQLDDYRKLDDNVWVTDYGWYEPMHVVAFAKKPPTYRG